MEGRRFPLEMHIVHSKVGLRNVGGKLDHFGENGIAVVAFFFEISVWVCLSGPPSQLVLQNEDNDDLVPFIGKLQAMDPHFKSNISLEDSRFEVRSVKQ